MSKKENLRGGGVHYLLNNLSLEKNYFIYYFYLPSRMTNKCPDIIHKTIVKQLFQTRYCSPVESFFS